MAWQGISPEDGDCGWELGWRESRVETGDSGSVVVEDQVRHEREMAAEQARYAVRSTKRRRWRAWCSQMSEV